MATGFPRSGERPGNRDAQSIAVVSIPGMPLLYSGVAIKTPSAFQMAALNSATTGGSPAASTSAL